MILQYYRVRDTFHACLLSRRTLKIVPLGSASELRRKLQLLRFQLSKFRLGAGIHQQVPAPASGRNQGAPAEFYEHLIAPIREGAEGRAPDRGAARVPALSALPRASGRRRAPGIAVLDFVLPERERLLSLLQEDARRERAGPGAGSSGRRGAAHPGRGAGRRIGAAGHGYLPGANR